MGRLFVEYLAIYNIENLPNSIIKTNQIGATFHPLQDKPSLKIAKAF